MFWCAMYVLCAFIMCVRVMQGYVQGYDIFDTPQGDSVIGSLNDSEVEEETSKVSRCIHKWYLCWGRALTYKCLMA